MEINKKTKKKLVCLIPKNITDEDKAKTAYFGNYLYKVRAVHRYSYDHSKPKRLILTDGKKFYELSKPRPHYSKNYDRYCKTIFHYEFKELESIPEHETKKKSPLKPQDKNPITITVFPSGYNSLIKSVGD